MTLKESSIDLLIPAMLPRLPQCSKAKAAVSDASMVVGVTPKCESYEIKGFPPHPLLDEY